VKRKPQRRWLRRLLRWAVLSALAFYGLVALSLVALRWIDPPFTSVHAQRRIESWFQKGEYRKRYTFVPMDRIARNFQHAVVAAEDTRFFEHHGFDWKEVQAAVEDEMDGGRWRGASTITQQLAKNLFFTTTRCPVRKVLEYAATPLVEVILSKRRILELYLNVVEWGPGVYGAEAAARYHYKTSASRIGREQGARLAALLPSPRRRHAARMNEYSARILERMSKMGW
jgi:monofunctional glycosyltransferase